MMMPPPTFFRPNKTRLVRFSIINEFMGSAWSHKIQEKHHSVLALVSKHEVRTTKVTRNAQQEFTFQSDVNVDIEILASFTLISNQKVRQFKK